VLACRELPYGQAYPQLPVLDPLPGILIFILCLKIDHIKAQSHETMHFGLKSLKIKLAGFLTVSNKNFL
jgi:hypothetical protein